MFGIGGFEFFLILLFGFLIFGPDKLPEIAKTVGRGIARFREAQREVNETIGAEKIFDPDNPDEPFKDPTVVLDKLAQKQEERKAAKAEAASKSDSAAGSSPDEKKQESFTERKARYERERAARKAAEAKGAASAAGESTKDANGAGPDDAAGATSGAGAVATTAESDDSTGADDVVVARSVRPSDAAKPLTANPSADEVQALAAEGAPTDEGGDA